MKKQNHTPIGEDELPKGSCATRPVPGPSQAKTTDESPHMPCPQLPVVQTNVVYQNVTVGRAAEAVPTNC
jgi:hypothetical protein